MSCSEDEYSVHSNESTQLPFKDRILRPLPKRARLERESQRSSDGNIEARSDSSQDSRHGGLPALLDPSSNSSTTEEVELPSTPPALQYYQPLFASVDRLVKQVASTTILFGMHKPDASLEKEEDVVKARSTTTDLSTEEYEADAEIEADTLAPNAAAKSAAATMPSRNQVSHPQGYPQDEMDLQAKGGHNNKKKRKIPSNAYFGPNHHHHHHHSATSDGEDGLSDDEESANAKDDDVGIDTNDTPIKDSKAKIKRLRSSQLYSPVKRRQRRSLPPEPDPASASSDPNINPQSSHGPPARKTLKSKKAAEDSTVLKETNQKQAVAKPKLVLNNLYRPALGPLYLNVMNNNTRIPTITNAPQYHKSSTSTGPSAVAFSFHVPLSSVLMTRLEDMNRERERLALAKELAKEKAREVELTRKRAELEEAVRKNEKTLQELKPVTTASVQTDGDLSGGKVIIASRWSTREASQPLQRPPKKVVQPSVTDESKKAPPRKGKKKRSAYANANNAHHRDNYVPSRQPRSGTFSQANIPDIENFPSLGLVDPQNAFSTANFHPQLGYSNLVPFFASTDEWLCSWCELDILFGDPQQFQKSIKKRSNLLRIRKKAQRRAARAASGQALTKEQKKEKAKQKAAASAKANPQAAPATDRKNASTQTVDDPADAHKPVVRTTPPTAESSGTSKKIANT